MDPLSVIAGVAGIATAGTALSSALFDIISSIRDAPKEMFDIAQGISNLSLVLRELQRSLKKGKKVYRDRLLRAAHSVIQWIEDVQDELYDLIDTQHGIVRILWAFRKSKAAGMLARIESHKSTVQLMATTMLLAIERKHQDRYGHTPSASSDKNIARLQREAENLVRASGRSIQNLLQIRSHHDRGTQTDELDKSTVAHHTVIKKGDPRQSQKENQSSNSASQKLENQIQIWDSIPNDTATWLYNLVFCNQATLRLPNGIHRQPSDDDFSTKSIVLDTTTNGVLQLSMNNTTEVVNNLLLQWTALSVDEVDEPLTVDETQRLTPWQQGLNERIEFHINTNDSADDGESFYFKENEYNFVNDSVRTDESLLDRELGYNAE